MAWRAQGMTGSNNIPLGSRRRGGDEPGDEDFSPAPPVTGSHDVGSKRGRSPARC